MRSISVADFCERSREILDDLRERDMPYVVTSGDKPVALLSPLHVSRPGEKKAPAKETSWKDYSRLAESLREGWPADRDSQTLLNELRR